MSMSNIQTMSWDRDKPIKKIWSPILNKSNIEGWNWKIKGQKKNQQIRKDYEA